MATPASDPNRAATDQEAQTIRAGISADMAALQAAVARQPQASAALYDARRRLADTQAAYSNASVQLEEVLGAVFSIEARIHRAFALLHPIRRVPVEILQAIFHELLRCTDEGASLCPGDPGLLELAMVPFRVSSVSQRWRAAALSYAPLWRLVVVADTGRQLIPYPRIHETYYKHFIMDGPLDVRIVLNNPCTYMATLLVTCDALLPAARSMSLSVPSDCISVLMRAMTSDKASRLEELYVHLAGKPVYELQTVLIRAPMLRRVAMAHAIPVFKDRVAMSSLASLDVDLSNSGIGEYHVDAARYLAVSLMYLPALEVLTVRSAGSLLSDAKVRSASVRFLNLFDLQFLPEQNFPIGDFPALDELEFTMRPNTRTALGGLIMFLHGPAGFARRVTWPRTLGLSRKIVANALGAMRRLEALFAPHAFIAPDFFAGFLRRPDRGDREQWPCRHLKSVVLRGCRMMEDSDDFTAGTVLDALRARRKAAVSPESGDDAAAAEQAPVDFEEFRLEWDVAPAFYTAQFAAEVQDLISADPRLL